MRGSRSTTICSSTCWRPRPRLGLTVMVHAENDAAIRRARARLIEPWPHRHPLSMPWPIARSCEREATHRALALAETDRRAHHIVHVSSWQSGEEIERARLRGVDVVAETCPQYSSSARRSRSPGARCRALRVLAAARSPHEPGLPLAGAGGRRIDLWSSDHSPYYFADKIGSRRRSRVPHDRERRARTGDPAAVPVFGRLADRQAVSAALPGSHLAQRRRDLRHGRPQGRDRRGAGCGHRSVGPRRDLAHRARGACTPASTSRPSRAAR